MSSSSVSPPPPPTTNTTRQNALNEVKNFCLKEFDSYLEKHKKSNVSDIMSLIHITVSMVNSSVNDITVKPSLTTAELVTVVESCLLGFLTKLHSKSLISDSTFQLINTDIQKVETYNAQIVEIINITQTVSTTIGLKSSSCCL